LSSHKDSDSTFLRANYTNLEGVEKDNLFSEAFHRALQDFFRKHPDMMTNPQKVEFLKYCYQHYINFDPQYRDLSLQEKLEEAHRLAADFWGTMFKL